jgi:signal transduction histidine kinase
MRIKTILIGGTLASGAVVAVVIGYLLAAAWTVDDSLSQDTITGAIIASTFEQSQILNDFLLYPGERARSQWVRKHEAVGYLLDDLAKAGREEDPLLTRMRTIHRKQMESFARLIEALRSANDDQVAGGALNELHEHRIAQVRSASQTMLSLATELGQEAEESLFRTLYGLAWGVAVLVAGMAALLAGVWFILGWRVVRPMAGLARGISDFRGGLVGKWHGIQREDEIGDVARAFEQMAGNLKTVMVSRDELAMEVKIRRRAECEAQELAESLNRRTSELDSVNKELETFAYSVSHDLRAPLRGMAGFCQALVEDYGDKLDDTGKDYVRRISAASKRMGQLIDDLLALSRVTRIEVKRSDVNLSDMAETIAEQLRRGEPDRKVEFKIKPGVTAQGDEALLRTMLENLLGNAWKYSAKNPRATIEFGIAANGPEPTFYIRDDGVGFDMAHADKLFKPFQRLHGSTEFEGTGIGLASVANIVRRHGGRIWADSTPDVGTTMRFTL